MNRRQQKRRAKNLGWIAQIRDDLKRGKTEDGSYSFNDLDYHTGKDLIEKYSRSLEQRYERHLHG